MQKLNSGALNRILLFVYILSLSTNAIAQNKNNSKETYLLPPHGNYVYGRVIEKLSKEPMVGVTIRLDGHSTGVITDINGCYVLTLPEKGGLVFYFFINRRKVCRVAAVDNTLVGCPRKEEGRKSQQSHFPAESRCADGRSYRKYSGSDCNRL